MQDLQTRLLFEIDITLGARLTLNGTPSGDRRIVAVSGGTFHGPSMKGVVVPGGGDWLIQRSDKTVQLDVRLTLRTDDDALIYMTYRGVRHGPEDVIDRLNRGEPVDPSSYYFRITPYFETGSEKYDRLNRIVSVGIGERRPEAVHYTVLEIL
jgi:hypothetical protein